MSLVQDHVIPLLPPQDCRVLESERIRGYADVEMILVAPPSPELLSAFGVAIVAEDFEARKELLEFHFPIQDDARRDDDQMWTPYSTIRGEVSQQGDRLNGLPEA